jgi:hypothetical protein
MAFQIKKLWFPAAFAACAAVGFLTVLYWPGPESQKHNEVVIQEMASAQIQKPETENKVTKSSPDQNSPSWAKELLKKPFMYPAVFAFGDLNSFDENRYIAFHWSATTQESVEAYRKYVSPLIGQLIRDKSLPYVLIIRQHLPDPKDSNGPGGLMLCPKDHAQYTLLANDYLLRGKNVEKVAPLQSKLDIKDPEILGALKKGPHYINDTALMLFKENRMDIIQCLINGEYNFRLARARGEGLQIAIAYGAENAPPYFVFPGEIVMRPSDPRLPKQIEKITTQPRP